MSFDHPEEEQDCPNSKDGHGHCYDWWDGDDCCWCDAPGLTREQKLEYGMDPDWVNVPCGKA